MKLSEELELLNKESEPTEMIFEMTESELNEHDAKIRANTIDSCKTVVMETIDNELLVDTLLMRMDKMNESMTVEEINKLKYEICCPLCDEPICVKGSSKCEAEIWEKRKLKEQNSNKLDK